MKREAKIRIFLFFIFIIIIALEVSVFSYPYNLKEIGNQNNITNGTFLVLESFYLSSSNLKLLNSKTDSHG